MSLHEISPATPFRVVAEGESPNLARGLHPADRASLLLRFALSAGKVVLILKAETAAETIRDNPGILDSAAVVLLQTGDNLSTMRTTLELP